MADRRLKRGCDKRGFALVTAVFVVAMVLLIGLTVSVVLYMEIVNATRSSSTTKALFAAEAGQEYGRTLLDQALQSFAVPATITQSNLDNYASAALANSRTNNRDIGVLVDFCAPFAQFMPRGQMGVVQGSLGTGQTAVAYQLAFDFTPTKVDYPAPSDPSGAYVFYYNYQITDKGTKSLGFESATQETRLTGSLVVTVFHPNFSFYDMFTVNMTTSSGQQIYFADGETMDGPVYVGGKPGFAGDNAGGGPTFTDQFQTTWSSWSTAAKTYNPVVNWNAEYPPLWGVPQVATPTNSFSQTRAAIGNYAQVGDTTTPVSNSELRTYLGLASGTTAPPTGIYYTKGSGGSTGNTTTTPIGGIYVQGDVQQMDLGVSGNDQIIKIKQSNVWTTIDINNAAGTTVITPPSGPQKNLTSAPNGVVQVNGTLNNVGRGTGYTAAIQSSSQMTISATNNLYVSNHINYQTDPTTDPTAQNVLGLMSGTGDVLVTSNAPSNLILDATIYAATSGHGFGVQNYDSKSPSGYLNLLGGMIMDSYQAIGTFSSGGLVSGYSKNFHYDRRFLNGAFAPPFFPVTKSYVGRLRSINRTDWGQVVPGTPAS